MNGAVHTIAVGSAHRPPRLPALAAAMRAELHTVLSGTSFCSMDDLSVLLSYLVDRTLDGQGDELTAYSVAVEGFGGIKGIETEHSGAPERHIDRLGAALEQHYAQNDPFDGLCLMLISGSYRIWIVRPEVAYPELYRRPKMVKWPRVPAARRIALESADA